MDVDEFLALPYGDRQLITFVPDADVDRPHQKELNSRDSAKRASGVQGAAAGTAVASAIAAAAAAIALPVLPIALILAPAGAIAAYLAKRSTGKGDGKAPRIHLLRKSWASRFILPPGHPRPRVVFAGHPAEPQNYIPIADFHRYSFEHKFSEILSILMHLGAQKIEVRHVRGWGQDFSERLSIGIPRATVSQGVDSTRREHSALLYEAELDGGPSVALPANLVWLPHESTWRQIVEGRTKFGLKTFSLNLQYTEDYGVNLGLKAEIQAVQLDLGGEFEKHQSTTWEIKGTFRSGTP
jgi:hypothetical protein